jgi:hypothetical protein
MAYRLEDLIRGSMRGGLIFGYVPANGGHTTPSAYQSALRTEMARAIATGLAADVCLSESLEELDAARTGSGITLCGLYPDRLLPADLERVLRCVKGEDRAFFTERYRADAAKHRKKPLDLTAGQRGTLFELFPQVHQDFVLVLAHEPRVAAMLRGASQAASPLFDYRHHYRIIELD